MIVRIQFNKKFHCLFKFKKQTHILDYPFQIVQSKYLNMAKPDKFRQIQ